MIVDENRKLITTQGRAAVTNDIDGKEFPWYPKPLNKLTGTTASQINDSPSLILFTSKTMYKWVHTTLSQMCPTLTSYRNAFSCVLKVFITYSNSCTLLYSGMY